MKSPSRNDVATAWFGALCFFLSAVEYLIPKPLPFLRLGLANLPIMLATEILSFPSFAVLVLIKIIAQGVIGGTLFSYVFLFSAAGTISSALIMYLLALPGKGRISYAGISTAGAFASNVAQISMARWFIFGPSAWYIAPPFFAVGTLTGFFLGLFANRFARTSRWFESLRTGQAILPQTILQNPIPSGGLSGLWNNPLFRSILGAGLLATVLFTHDIRLQAIVTCFALLLLLLDKGKVQLLPTLIMVLSIIVFNLLTPFGRVIIRPLGFPITEGALLSGLKKALTLEGMLFISRWMMKPGFTLPGKPGVLVSQVLKVLGYLTARRELFDPKHPIASIDKIMLEASPKPHSPVYNPVED